MKFSYNRGVVIPLYWSRKLATSTCSKCSNTSFEVVTVDSTNRMVSGTKFKYQFIQCASCGTVVGVLERHNITTQLNQIKELLAELKAQIR